jgi:dTDP-4-amino-4,6-dideoxygalactose transaminase
LRVPFSYLPEQFADPEPIFARLREVIATGDFTLGKAVGEFEARFADAVGVRFAFGVGSGTEGLRLALKTLGVGPGDEVITAANTFIATVGAIADIGAVTKFVDCKDDFCMDVSLLEAAITPRTKAIVPVHLYGQAADMDAILALARAHKLRVIEDCAQCTGGRYGARRLGSLGDIACFSFYPTKNLGAIGDGGMVITSDADLAARVRRLRQYGWDEARKTHEVGRNSRLDPVQAAILAAKLPHLDADNARRAAIAARYDRGLAGLSFVVPAARANGMHVYHLYVVRCDDRARVAAHLRADQIGSAVHYAEPVHVQKGYAEKCVLPKGGLPVTDATVDKILSLPIYPELTEAEIDRVIASLRRHADSR